MKTIEIAIPENPSMADLLSAFQTSYAAEAARVMEKRTAGVSNGEVVDSPIQIRRYSEHVYMVTGFKLPELPHPVAVCVTEAMQNPPENVIYETGTYQAFVFQSEHSESRNGITMEALLSICKDRLELFNQGAFYCSENEQAIEGIGKALHWLNERMVRVLKERACMLEEREG